jgi:hypothetical protein
LTQGLASGINDRQAPFTRIARKQSEFILSKYIPRGLFLKDPRAMRKEEITKFFEHVENRQSSHGIKDAFRFKAVLSSRKKAEVIKSKYEDLRPGPDLTETTQTPALEGSMIKFRFENYTAPAQTVSLEPEVDVDTAATPHLPAVAPPHPRKTTRRNAQAPAQQIGLQAQAPAPAPAPPRPTGKAKLMSRPTETEVIQELISANPDEITLNRTNQGQSTLMFDPGYQWEPDLELDPSLDPAFDGQPPGRFNDELLMPWLTLPRDSQIMGPSMMETRSPGSDLDRTPRRRGKKADMLAIEEAQTLMAKTTSRRSIV